MVEEIKALLETIRGVTLPESIVLAAFTLAGAYLLKSWFFSDSDT